MDKWLNKWLKMQGGKNILKAISAKWFIQIFSKAKLIEKFEVGLHF